MSHDVNELVDEYSVTIPVGDHELAGSLTIPVGANGLVLFVHGSGSSRHSPRNRSVAQSLQRRGLGTLLFDLLTPDEENIDLQTRQFRFDIELLADRVARATEWLTENSSTRDLRFGYFGASTGAAAALAASAQWRGSVAAVVSRGGRPDLAGDLLEHVRAPVLLVVGGQDAAVLELNQQALKRLTQSQETMLSVVPGATHLFEEPGALEEVARLAGDWFVRYLNQSAFTDADWGGSGSEAG